MGGGGSLDGGEVVVNHGQSETRGGTWSLRGLARVYIWLAASFVFVDDIAVKEKVEG